MPPCFSPSGVSQAHNLSGLVADERTVKTETAAPCMFSNDNDLERESDGHAGFHPLGDRNNGRNGGGRRSAPCVVGFPAGIQDPELGRLLRDRGNGAVPREIAAQQHTAYSDVGTNTRRIRAFLKKFVEASKTGG